MAFPLRHQIEKTELDPARYDELGLQEALAQYEIDLEKIHETHRRNLDRIDQVFHNQTRLTWGVLILVYVVFFTALVLS